MSIDGFDDACAQAYGTHLGVRAERFWRIVQQANAQLHVEMVGARALRSGPAVLVMNHAFGWDAVLPMAAIREATGRQVWVLGEHLWWKIPFLRKLAADVGAVDGTPHNVDALLSNGELVLVLPGGLREAMKPRELRYRLLWGNRFGFVRAALRNHAPLVPLAGIGADDVFDLVGNAYGRGRRWLDADFPIPRPRWGIPFVRFPHLKYIVGEPISSFQLDGDNEESTVRRLRREVRGALEELIDEALAARAGIRTTAVGSDP